MRVWRSGLVLATLVLFGGVPVAGADLCPANPPLYAEKAGAAITKAETDEWLGNVRHLCQADQAVGNHWDFATGALSLPRSTTLPVTCAVGEVYFDTDALAGFNIFCCTSVNTWTLCGDGGGGGGGVTVREVDGSPSVAASTLEVDSVDGLTVSDSGGGVARLDLSGVPDAVLAVGYSGVGSCGANQAAVTLTRAAAPACSEFSALGQTIGAGEIEVDAVGLASLDDGAGVPAAGDYLRVAAGAATVEYLTPHAGSDVATDLEEEQHGTEHEIGGADELSIEGLLGEGAEAQKVGVEDAGVLVAARPRLNLLEGSNVTLTIAEDAPNDRVNVTITSAVTGGTVAVREVDGSPSVTASTIEFDETTGLTVTDQGAGVARVTSAGGGDSPYTGAYHPDRPPSTCNACEETGSDLTWAWANQDDATITAELGTLLLDSVDASGGASTHERNVRWTTLPTGVDWAVTAKLNMGGGLDANTDAGLIVLASGTRASPTLMYLLSRGIRNASFDSFQTLCRSVVSYVSGTTDIGGPESTQHALGPWWLQFRFNTTTNALSCWLSQDGMTWVSMAPAQSLGADPTDVGIFVDARSVSGTIQARYEYIRVRTDASGLTGVVGE